MNLLLIGIHVTVLVWVINASMKLSGLNGGYGKGVWSNNSSYMLHAEENLMRSVLAMIALIVIDLFIIFN